MAEEKKLHTILIVEDDEYMIQALEEKFKSSGFETMTAKNGEEGLKLALEKHPDLIILDILMPKMDGLTMLKHLKTDPWGNTASVMVLTNLSDNDKLAEALEIGVVEYVIKAEVQLSEIISKAKRILGMI